MKARAKAGQRKDAALAGPCFVFPGPNGWELWTQQGGRFVCTGPADAPGKLRPPPGCVFCIPSRSFFSLPLWVPNVAETPERELTALALEKRGILGASPETAVWNSEVIRAEPVPAPEGESATTSRQLEATAILQPPFQDDWIVEEAGRHEPAGRTLPVPGAGTAGVLRRELGSWVLDLYEAGKWIHSQPLLARELDGEAAVEIETLLAQLAGEEVLAELDQLRVWEEAPGPEFLAGLSCPVQTIPRPSPESPARPWNLPPPVLTERRLAKKEKTARTRQIRLALTAYGAVLFLAAVYFAYPSVRLWAVEREYNRIRAPAETIRDTAMMWRDAGAWLDPRANVLEVLWQVSRPLIEKEPALIEGVRLTLFDMNPRRILLQGEGKDLQVVEKYFEWLKTEPALGMFQWKNPQPRLLPNGNAQFQAEGTAPWAVASEPGEGEDANAVSP